MPAGPRVARGDGQKSRYRGDFRGANHRGVHSAPDGHAVVEDTVDRNLRHFRVGQHRWRGGGLGVGERIVQRCCCSIRRVTATTEFHGGKACTGWAAFIQRDSSWG